MSGFGRKVKRKQATQAMKSLGALGKMAEMTQQLEDVLKANSALVEENHKFQEEIGLTLEDHHKDIAELKKEVFGLQEQVNPYDAGVRR